MSTQNNQKAGAELDMPMDIEASSKGHPKGLYVLFATEFWERFSYYGMRAIFSLYMLKMLLLDKAETSSIYGSYTGLVYLTPLMVGSCKRKIRERRDRRKQPSDMRCHI